MVTGAHGFVGQHLVALLRARDVQVIAVGKEPDSSYHGTPGVEYVRCDLLVQDAVDDLLKRAPAAIINLAGLAAVGPSYRDPDLYLRTNRLIVENLCGTALRRSPGARLLIVSSGAVYDPDQTLPLTEKSVVTGASSPYAMSKLESERAALEARAEGLDVVIVRPFNHLGPGQDGGFLLPDLVSRMREATPAGPLVVGNLATARDYTDVRDVARAYVELLQPPTLEHDVYNVCSGRPVTGTALLQLLFEATGEIVRSVEADAALLRPVDASVLYGDYSRLQREIGWEPKISLAQSVRDYVQWRNARG